MAVNLVLLFLLLLLCFIVAWSGQYGGARPPRPRSAAVSPLVTRVEQTYITQHTVSTIMLPDSAHYVTMSHCLCYNTMSIAH